MAPHPLPRRTDSEASGRGVRLGQGVRVGQGALTESACFVGGDAEHAQEVFGDEVGRRRVVAAGFVVQQLAQGQGSAGDDGEREVGVAHGGEPAGADGGFDVAAGAGGEALAGARQCQAVVQQDQLSSGCSLPSKACPLSVPRSSRVLREPMLASV
jgi:hypothetical protein